MNTDRAWNQATGAATGGGVICDELGRWVLGFFVKFHAASPLAAEFLAFRQGLIYSREHGFDNLIAETGAKGLIDNITKPNNAANHELGVIIDHINELMGRNWNVEITWAKAEANEVAHVLASMAYDNADDKTIYLDVPCMARKVYEADLAGFMQCF